MHESHGPSCHGCCAKLRRCACRTHFRLLFETRLILCFFRSENLQSIDLSFVHQLTDVAIRSLAEHCPNLRQIVILDCAFGSSATNDLIKRCGHVLEDITLGSCADESTAAESSRNDNTRLMTIANHCPALVRLDVSGDGKFGNQTPPTQ